MTKSPIRRGPECEGEFICLNGFVNPLIDKSAAKFLILTFCPCVSESESKFLEEKKQKENSEKAY